MKIQNEALAFCLCLTVLALAFVSVNCSESARRDGGTKSDTVTTQTETVNLPAPYATKSVWHFSNVIGWPEGKTPIAPEGFKVTKFAGDLISPRNIYVAPNGDIFVAEANTELSGIKRITILACRIHKVATVVWKREAHHATKRR